MASWSQRVILKNVVPLNREIGRGSYGRVFTVKYCGLVCAAKEIHSILLDSQVDDRESVIQRFLEECHHCSELRHPNIVQFMGVYYTSSGDQMSSNLPIMVMELMECSLASLVERHVIIEMKTKISILHDVSLGLSYLHAQTQPVVHRDLSPNNILLTNHFVAKIGDLGVARVMKAGGKTSKLTKAPGTVDFMAPETFNDNPEYGTPLDVFSFAGIAIHLLCEEWPTPTQLTQMDPRTGKLTAFTEVERRQKYFDKMGVKISLTLKRLLINCLNNDSTHRPLISAISEKIELLKETKVLADEVASESNPKNKCRGSSMKPAVAPKPHRMVSHSRTAPLQHSNTLPHLKSGSSVSSSYTSSSPGVEQHMPRSKSSSIHADLTASLPNNFMVKGNSGLQRCVASPQPCGVYTANANQSSHTSIPPEVPKKNIQRLVHQLEAAKVGVMQIPKAEPKARKVPLISALQSGRHHIKWRACANLIFPMYAASVAVDDQHVYAMGDCTEEEALNLVFVYTIATDLWAWLPPSDHCWGILQIVGNKLAIFGGIDVLTGSRTNKVSAFDKATDKWSSYYPNMIGTRFRPGVATHLDYVIVAGGNEEPTVVRSDIELLNWKQRLHWVKSSVSLPAPMWAFSPVISNDEFYIVGYTGGDGNMTYKEAYKIPVIAITSTVGQKYQGRNEWVEMPTTAYYYNSLIPGSSPPVFAGGEDGQGVQSSNISMYDSVSDSWRYVDSLSSPRASAAIATIDNYTIIVIGGYTKGRSATAAKLSSLSTVELGEAELA